MINKDLNLSKELKKSVEYKNDSDFICNSYVYNDPVRLEKYFRKLAIKKKRFILQQF